MENLVGLLRIHVKRGVNLAIRDISSSDPYVVVHSGKQVIKNIIKSQNFILFHFWPNLVMHLVESDAFIELLVAK